MPDYFRSALSTGCAGHPGAAAWSANTYTFPASEAPDALFIDLGTNDIAVRSHLTITSTHARYAHTHTHTLHTRAHAHPLRRQQPPAAAARRRRPPPQRR